LWGLTCARMIRYPYLNRIPTDNGYDEDDESRTDREEESDERPH
jgi:hypothetical protein